MTVLNPNVAKRRNMQAMEAISGPELNWIKYNSLQRMQKELKNLISPLEEFLCTKKTIFEPLWTFNVSKQTNFRVLQDKDLLTYFPLTITYSFTLCIHLKQVVNSLLAFSSTGRLR